MKLIIAGSRDINDYGLLRQIVIESGVWTEYKRTLEIVCGMARGVDKLGLDFAEKNGLKLHPFPADWDNVLAPGAIIKYRGGRPYNAKAGHDRNKKMADFADGLLALWDGESSGTGDMIELARGNRLKMWVYVCTKYSVEGSNDMLWTWVRKKE